MSLEKVLRYEFERNLEHKRVKFQFRGDTIWHMGKTTEFNSRNQQHKIIFDKKELGSVWIDMTKERHHILIEMPVDGNIDHTSMMWKPFTSVLEENFVRQQ